MNPKYKASWLRALRSGQFKQGKQRFYADGNYCCLGVLCKIAGVPFTVGPGDEGRPEWRVAGNLGTLNFELRNEFDIPGEVHQTLVQMNDLDNKSFAEIADWIEENL